MMVNKLKVILPAAIISGAAGLNEASAQTDSLALPKDSVATIQSDSIDRFARYREAEVMAMALIAFTEDCAYESYFCGARWTIGFGNTYHPDGRRVQRGEKITDNNKLLDYVRSHCEKKIYPQLDKYLQRNLPPQQMAALISLFYNVHPVSLTGENDEGIRKKEPSMLINMLNQGRQFDECAGAFMEFCHSGEKELLGLVRRRCFEAMCFSGDLTYEDILKAKVASVYFINPYRVCKRQKVSDGKRSKNLLVPKRDAASINYVCGVVSKGKRQEVGAMLQKFGVSFWRPAAQFLSELKPEINIPKLEMPKLEIPKLTKIIKIRDGR